MRVLYVTPSYYPALKYGGPILSSHLLNKALIRRRIHLDVLTSNAGLKDCPTITSGRWLTVDGVHVLYLPYWGYEHFTFSPAILWQAIQIVRQYDLVHINAVWNFPVLAAAIASGLRRRPYIISPRGTLYHEAIELKSSMKKKLYYLMIARYYLNRAAAIHLTSEDERKGISYLYLKSRSFVVPNGIELSEFAILPLPGSFKNEYPALQGKEYLLFLGRIHAKKGLDLLVKSFQNLALNFPRLSLVIAGPDNDGYREKVAYMLGQAGLTARTIFPGMLTGVHKLAALVDAQCLVLPSYTENFGMAVVEAMACGTPVVISDKVGLWDEVKRAHAGMIVKAEPDSLYQGIKAVLENPTLRAKISQNGRALASHYDIENVVEKMIEAYKETTGFIIPKKKGV